MILYTQSHISLRITIYVTAAVANYHQSLCKAHPLLSHDHNHQPTHHPSLAVLRLSHDLWLLPYSHAEAALSGSHPGSIHGARRCQCCYYRTEIRKRLMLQTETEVAVPDLTRHRLPCSTGCTELATEIGCSATEDCRNGGNPGRHWVYDRERSLHRAAVDLSPLDEETMVEV